MKMSDQLSIFAKLGYIKLQMFGGIDILYKVIDDQYKIILVIHNYGKEHILSESNLSDIMAKIEVNYNFNPDNKFNFLTVINSANKKDRVKLRMKNVIYFLGQGKAKYEKCDAIFEEELEELTNYRNVVESTKKMSLMNDAKNYCSFPLITLLIIAGCIWAYLKGIDQLQYGISYKKVFMEGKWINLVTFSFLHSSLLHLIGNISSIAWSGIYLEKKIGKFKYLILVIVSSIYCGLMSCILNYSNHSVELTTVGLSGVIYAILGTIIVYLIAEKKRSIFIILFTIFSLIIGMGNARIDNMTHIAGLVLGIYSGISFIGIVRIKKNITKANYYKMVKNKNSI